MKKYIGIKEVEAEPMEMGEAYEKGLLQAGKVPTAAQMENKGYHVRYKDGYESWSPMEAFMYSYKAADTPMERMLIEGDELTTKLMELKQFTHSEKFQTLDEQTRAMMAAQSVVMEQYQDCLNQRYAKMDNGVGNFDGFSFGIAVSLLNAGFCVRRKGWNGKGMFVVKQIPAHITEEIIPKMQSLPQSIKNILMKRENKFIDYTNQMLLVQPSGRADSWVPSSSDVFAQDWELATE